MSDAINTGVGRTRSSSGFPFMPLASQSVVERRLEDKSCREVERWHGKALADSVTGVTLLAASMAASIRLRVTNPVKTSLHDVHIDIELDGPLHALDCEDSNEEGLVELFPERALDWGSDSIASVVGARNADRFSLARSTHGMLRITQTSPARLSLPLDLLRAGETFVSDADEVVLVAYVEAETDQPITGQRRLTAADVLDVLDGNLSVTDDYRDWP